MARSSHRRASFLSAESKRQQKNNKRKTLALTNNLLGRVGYVCSPLAQRIQCNVRGQKATVLNVATFLFFFFFTTKINNSNACRLQVGVQRTKYLLFELRHPSCHRKVLLCVISDFKQQSPLRFPHILHVLCGAITFRVVTHVRRYFSLTLRSDKLTAEQYYEPVTSIKGWLVFLISVGTISHEGRSRGVQ